MNDLKIFESKEFGQVRTITINNEPYFAGKDVANALGFKDSVNALKQHVELDDMVKHHLTDSLGRLQETTIINESGLYALIFGSKLESAKRFKKWVTSEVLPSIREAGIYQKPLTALEQLNLHNQAIIEVNSKVELVDKDLQTFKQDLPLLGCDMDRITTAVKKMGVKCLGGKESNAYKDKPLRTKVYSDIYEQLKRQFGVSSYKSIKRNQLDMSLTIIEHYALPLVLQDEIKDRNAQMCLGN